MYLEIIYFCIRILYNTTQHNMKKFLPLVKLLSIVVLSLLANNSFAQVSNYTFAQSSGTYTPITGGTLHGTADNANYSFTLPFNFTYNGTVYTATKPSTNGFLVLGANAPSTTQYTPLSSGTTNFAISPYAADLNSTVRSEVLGTAPNRIYVCQWSNAGRYALGLQADAMNFQIRLYETTNAIEVIYGSSTGTTTSSTVQVGLRGSANTDYNNRTATTTWAGTTAGIANTDAVTYSSTIKPTSGLTFRWAPYIGPTVSTGSLTAFGNACINTTAGPNSFTLSGANLTGDLTLGTLAGYTYSTTSTGTYSTTLTLSPTSGAISQTVYVKFTPTLVQSYAGNIVISGGGLPTSKNVAASGSGINTAPTVSVNGISGTLTTSSAVISGSAISASGCSAVTSYGVKYSTTSGFDPITTGIAVAGTGFSGSTFNTTLSGLTPSTTYYYRAYATNSGGTTYFGTVDTFTTACGAVTSFPWTEGFEGVTTGTTVVGTATSLPSCWNSGSTKWSTSNATTYNTANTGGSKYLRYAWSTTNAYIWTPGFQLTSGVSYDFSFYAQGDGYTSWVNDVFVNSSQSATGATQLTPSYSPTGPGSASIQPYFLVKRTFTPSTSGVYYFSIRGNESTGSPWYMAFDDFKLELTPNCITPSLAATTNIAATTATINWTAPTPAPANGYNYEIRTSGAAGSGATGLTASGSVAAGITAANITGLSAATTYSLYVQSDCGGSGTSTWSVAGTFTTACALPTEPNSITYTAVTASTTTVNWLAPTTTPTAYVVFRSTSATPPTLTNGTGYIATTNYTISGNVYRCVLNSSALNYVNTGLTSNTKYYYYVFSRNGTNGTAPDCYGAPWYSVKNLNGSQITCAAAPTLPVNSNITSNNATVSWTASIAGGAAGVINYTLEVATDNLFNSPVSGSPFNVGSATTYALSGLTANTTYYYRIKANNGTCDSTYLSSSFYTGYCIPSSTGNSAYFTNFSTTLGYTNINNTTGLAPGGYQDNTSMAVSREAGSSFTYSFTLNTTNLNAAVAIWVDWNNDSTFQNSEQVYTSAAYIASGTYTGSIAVPAGAGLGNYRLRIVTDYSTTSPSPCSFAGSSGEAEDYTVSVVTPLSPITITSSATLPICAGTSTTLTANSTVGYSYSWSPATGLNTTTGAIVIATPLITTTYRVTGTLGTVSNTKDFTVTVNPAPTAITLTETSVSPGGVTACDLDYVKLDVANNNAVSVLTEGFENNTNIFTADIFSGAIYYDNALKTEGTRSINFYGDYTSGPDYIGLDLTNSIDLTKYSAATFTFDHICASEKGSDFGELYYSINGGSTWIKLPTSAYVGTAVLKQGFVSFDKSSYTDWNTAITSASSVPTNTLWKSETINLSQFLTASNFKLGFSYSFDSSIDYWGWNMDNIKINTTPKVSWTPITGLYTDTALTVPYVTNANVTTVYAAPEVATAFTAAASLGTCAKTVTSASIIRTKKTFTGADSTNPTLWNEPNNWSTKVLPSVDKCVSIPAGKTAVINIPNAVAKTVTVATGGKLTINAQQTLTVKEIFTNNAAVGDVMIESDGNLIQMDNVTNVNPISARRTITIKNNAQYNYLMSPLTGSNLKTNIYDGTVSAPFTLYHNEANNKFYNSIGTYILGRGLAVKEPASGSGTITALFTGVPMNGAFSYTLANSNVGAGTSLGYNLTGNPYPSNIDLDKFYNLATNKDKISPTFYFWDNTVNTVTVQGGSNYNGAAYAIFNAVAGDAGTGLAAGSLSGGITGTKTPTRVVKTGQGFMVQSISTANKSIDFDNTIRIPDSNPIFFGKDGQRPDDRFWLKLSAPTDVTTQIAVVYFDDGNNAFAKDDSEMNGLPSDVLYSLIGDKKVLINGRSTFINTDVISLGSNNFAAGSYTFSLGEREGAFAADQNIYVRDKQTGIITNLTSGNYMFTANAGENTGRFEIVYLPEAVLATDGNQREGLVVYREGNDYVVKAQSKKITNLQVFDTAGRLMLSLNPNAAKAIIPAEKIVSGVYVLKIDQGGLITTKKIIR